MPKSKQKQKQKQSQVTKVSVKIGDTNKPKRKSRPRSAPVAKQPSSIGITLQGTGVVFPSPPTQQYNELVQQMDALRRQMALSGSLIPRAATNDIFNRVQATNPFANVSKSIPMATLIKPEGIVEEAVEGLTTIDPTESHGFALHKAYDQDWINNVALANKAQSFAGITSKIGISEDPETIQDINNFDYDQTFRQREMETMYGEDLRPQKVLSKERKQIAGRAVREIFSAEKFTPVTSNRGRPKKMPAISPF